MIEEINELDNAKEKVENHLLEEQVVSDFEDKTNIHELEYFNAEANTSGIKHLLELLNSIGPLKKSEKSTEINKEPSEYKTLFLL